MAPRAKERGKLIFANELQGQYLLPTGDCLARPSAKWDTL